MIIAIGNSPSSGSTYLSDLLDSTSISVCGPELHLFSVQQHFDNFEKVREAGFPRGATSCCYSAYAARFLTESLPQYGMTREDVNAMIHNSVSFPEFCETFFNKYASYREKTPKLFFEKTPENICMANRFLNCFPDSVFLHIVRHPLFVYRSLRNRGAPFSIAAITWMVDVAFAFNLRTHPRFYTMKYEDLSTDPISTIKTFFQFLGEDIFMDDLEQRYKENTYRSDTINRPKSWTHNEYGQMANSNVDLNSFSDGNEVLEYLSNLTIGLDFAEIFGISPVSFKELVAYYGYSFPETRKHMNPIKFTFDNFSRIWLLKKWLKGLIGGATKFSELPAYLNPVVKL